jgi:hypothetical protein
MLFHEGVVTRVTTLLFAVDEHYDDGQDNTDDYACGERKIESEILALVKKVAGKFSEPRYFFSQKEKESQACDDQADKN